MTIFRMLPLVLLASGCSPGGPARAEPGAAPPGPEGRLPVSSLELPPGFEIAVFAEVPGARSLALGAEGTVFIGTRKRQGTVYAVRDRDGDGRAEEQHVVASGLDTPNGVAFRDGALYVAEISRVLRFPGIEKALARPPRPEVVYDALPTERHHGWKFIAFGPDGLLYVPIARPATSATARIRASPPSRA